MKFYANRTVLEIGWMWRTERNRDTIAMRSIEMSRGASFVLRRIGQKARMLRTSFRSPGLLARLGKHALRVILISETTRDGAAYLDFSYICKRISVRGKSTNIRANLSRKDATWIGSLEIQYWSVWACTEVKCRVKIVYSAFGCEFKNRLIVHKGFFKIIKIQ